MTRQRGFTIVELIIYMGILSLLLLVLTQLFGAALDVQRESESSSSVVQDGKFILSRLFYDISNAQSITVPAAIGSTSATLQFTKNGISYTYAVNNENLQITDNIATDALNSFDTKITAFSFKRIGNSGGKHTIQVQFTLVSKTTRPDKSEIKDFQTTVGLR